MSTIAPSYIFSQVKKNWQQKALEMPCTNGTLLVVMSKAFSRRFGDWEIEPQLWGVDGFIECWSVDGNIVIQQNSILSWWPLGPTKLRVFVLGLYQLPACVVLLLGPGEMARSKYPVANFGTLQEFERRWSLEEELGRKADKDCSFFGGPFFLAADRQGCRATTLHMGNGWVSP